MTKSSARQAQRLAADTSPLPVDLPYRIAWRSRALRQGMHRSVQSGAGGSFKDLTSLFEHRDPRRIDLRQSLRDPFDTLYVRRFEEKSRIGVTMLVDVSGSMGFEGSSRKMSIAAELARVFASAVRRAGDTFGLYVADDRIHDELSVTPTRNRGGEAEMVAALRAYQPGRSGASALVDAALRIGTKRNMVLVVSDFLLPEADLAALFEALTPHDVIPIRIVDSREALELPNWGLIELADLETGRRRLVVMRPKLKAEWQARLAARRSAFRALAARYGRTPFEITNAVPWDRLGSHLATGA